MTTQTKTTVSDQSRGAKAGWRKVNLGDVATLHRGYDLPVEKIEKGNFPVIFSNGKIESHNKFKIKGPGVVTGRSGSLGNIFYIAKDYWPHNTTLYVSDFHENNPKFVYYLLKRLDFAKFNAGTGVPTLNRNHIHGLNVLIPEDPKDQKRIAEILSAFDDKIELNNKISRMLEEMAQAIFKEWFIDSEKLKVKSEKLEEVAEVIKGKKPQKIYDKPRGGDLEYLLIESLTTNNRFFSDDDKIPKSEEGDVIVVMDGASSGRILRGRKGTVGSTLAVVKPRQGISREFLLLLLKQVEPQLMYNLTGSAIPHLDKDFLKTYPVSVPTSAIMERFTIFVSPMFQKIVEVKNENQKLAALRDLFLPKLMSGEIKV